MRQQRSDPEVRAREVESRHRRREDPEFRFTETESFRRRRNEDLEFWLPAASLVFGTAIAEPCVFSRQVLVVITRFWLNVVS